MLPEFNYGNKSPELYNSGAGLCDTRELENADFIPYFRDGMEITEKQYREILKKLDDDGIPYTFQYGLNGCPSVKIARNKRYIDVTYSEGKAEVKFRDEYNPQKQNDVLVTTYTEVKAEEYWSYISELENAGFEHIFSNNIEGNMFDEFKTDKGLYNISFIKGTVRALFDTVSLTVKEMSDSTEYGKSEVYQYGLRHVLNRGGYSMDCGMCYVIKCPDNSLIMIDGGYYSQCSMDAVVGLMELMHRLGGEKIRLSWFCTHAHDDHIDMFAKIIRLYHDEIDLQKVIFNFPSDKICGNDWGSYMMYNRVLKYYPNVKYRKIHAGDKMNFGGCSVEVLSTHECSTGAVGSEIIGGFNDTSSVVKFHLDPSVTNGNADFLVLGDIDNSAEAIIVSEYSSKTLHSGIVQTAHHLFNKLEKIYDETDADIALVPQSEKTRTNHDKTKYLVVLRSVPYDNFYFSNNGTDGFAIKDGKVSHIFNQPRIGGIYDGSLT